MAAAAARGQLVVVDAYAVVPAVQAAAPAFARMSEKYDARFARST